MTRIFLFPGQGSQKIGMGGTLFDRFKEQSDCASNIPGYSIKALCLEDPEEKLNLTTHTQPVIYTVNALTLMARLEAEGDPDWVAGHSLGEYNAFLAAGAFDFPSGLAMVRKRVELMCKAKGGGMAALVGLSAGRIREILRVEGFGQIDVANFNTPAQTVLSGPEAEIKRAGPVFQSAGARIYLRLNVSVEFHSRYMSESRDEFREFLTPMKLRPLRVPAVANCTAAPFGENQVLANLVTQLTSPVQWTATIDYFFSLEDPVFEEIRPSNVLTGMLANRVATAKG